MPAAFERAVKARGSHVITKKVTKKGGTKGYIHIAYTAGGKAVAGHFHKYKKGGGRKRR
jgi:hypothetical protein